MKHLNEFLNEAEGLKPNDKITYHIPDLMEPNKDMGDDFYEGEDIEQAKGALVFYDLVKKGDIKKIKIENLERSPNDNWELDITATYKILKKAIGEVSDGMDMSIEELISDGTIKKV